MKLNLGAGDKPIDGYESIDLFPRTPGAKEVDLLQFPWPWEDESIDAIALHHVLEHFTNIEDMIMELHRILKPGGELWIRVPHGLASVGHQFYHFRTFSHASFSHVLCGQAPYRFGGVQVFRETYYHCTLPFSWMRFFEKFASRHADGWEMSGLFPPVAIEWKGVKV